ncbi:FAD-binding protein [Sporomusa sp.]|uniref:FAD-binding protein n=1 Tax=Sporomusa sp. TaxID=2078658 RepID=UPI002D00337B|nr:FAD-binding protein [Sporomusa sp.]HWR41884.1 FAD-binding protein [Sporomusa sp.]
MKTINCDVLVIGGGGAALRSAIAAKEAAPGKKVTILTKGRLGLSGVTATACSDRMAFHATLEHTEPQHTDMPAWQYHADDIYRIGGQVSDYNLAAVMASRSGEAYRYLETAGVPFVKRDGVVDQFVTDGSDYARACYTGPKTAVHIEQALVPCIAQLGIEVINYAMAVKLLTENSRVIGVAAADTRAKNAEEALFIVEAGAVILATGGGGLIYENNVFPGGMTGDGYALAYAAGAELVNMEFIQFGIASVRTKLNCSGSMMRCIPRLINDQDEEFLKNYFPAGTAWSEIYDVLFKKGASWPVSYEHTTRIIDVALYKEKQAGRKIFLDFSKNPEGFDFAMLSADNQARYRREMTVELTQTDRYESPINRLKEINQASIDWLMERNIDLTKGELLEVATCAQHYQGGVKINEFAQTTIAGLYAVGETAGGQHGANRPGGNALLDCQVYGAIAGENAAKEQAGDPKGNLADSPEILALQTELRQAVHGRAAAQLRKAIKRIMEGAASIVRTEDRLDKAIAELAQLAKQPVALDDNGVAYYFEAKNMLKVAAMVLAAARERDESRGPHLKFACYQDDQPVPRKNGEWDKYVVIYAKNGQLTLEHRLPNQPKA